MASETRSFLECTDTLGHRSSRYMHMEETTRMCSDEDRSKRSSIRKFNKIARNIGSTKREVKKVKTESSLKRFSDFACSSEKNLRVGLSSHCNPHQLKGTLSIPKLQSQASASYSQF
jgi:hypothetical protein